jgi:hypothetical protein
MTIRYCNLRKKKSTYFGIIEKENPGQPRQGQACKQSWREMVVGTKK